MPCVQFLNSSPIMSDCFVPFVFFHSSLYKTTISSTGAITTGAEVDFQEPQAVRLEIFL